jgi:hypothetical protein
MTAWTDHHYTRAQEFTRLLAEALAAAKAPEATPTLELTTAPFMRAPAAPAPAPAAPAPGPSASSVFKKIPWKK